MIAHSDPSSLAHTPPEAYGFIFVFLLASAVIVPIFQRFRVSGVLGFLLVGVLLGPAGLGALQGLFPKLSGLTTLHSETVAHLAELGVVFLLFTIGLELNFERLRAMRRMILGLGVGQMVLCTVGLFILFIALGQSRTASVILAMALALSSTAVIVPVLADQKALNTTGGRSIFSILLAQDLAVAPILITTALLTGAVTGHASGAKGLLALIPAILGLGLIYVLGRWLLRPLFNSVAITKSRELFMAACLLVVLGASQLAAGFGLTMGLGAFVAGVMLGETEYRREIEVMIEPFQGLLLGLFFVTIGARLDLVQVLAHPTLIIGLALVVILIKAVLVYPLARRMGLGRRVSFEVAAVIGPAGEFAFLIIDQAIGQNALDPRFGQAVILSAILSLMAVPALVFWGQKLIASVTAAQQLLPSESPDMINEDAKVLIVGFGRVGELVAQMLQSHDIGFTVVDSNPKVTERARAMGHEVWYGNASNPDFLRRLRIERAKAVVVTASNPTFTDEVVKALKAVSEDTVIVARARDALHAQRLYGLGATDAVPETIEASLQLAENTLIELGVPMGLVLASIHERRDVFRKAFGLRERRKTALRDRVTP